MKGNTEGKLKNLARKLGYAFSDLKILLAAVTHRSMGGTNNERLEFLGDSILNFTIAAELYTQFPKAKEGELTRMRARLVCEEMLADIAKELKVGECLILGAGELKTGGFQRKSILADALEAIIGAIFLDAGLETTRACVLEWYKMRMNEMVSNTSLKDAKTRLQEVMQAKHLPLPEYTVLEITGDAHNPTFKVQCSITTLKEPEIGEATSRRIAEQLAAEKALKAFLK